ncbi:hypothetical protein H0H93_014422 [Arthromyces matolae]|nr:hypothetical protein H0H93_014422 [Arthromyces matolae]
MLKRQRIPTPPPSTQYIPLVDDSYSGAKRRRILPPSLDGRLRGWADNSLKDKDDNDNEDDISSVGTESTLCDFRSSTTSNPSEYKEANVILHELHALYQHRLIFTSTHLPTSQQSTFSSQHTPQYSESTLDGYSNAVTTTTALYPDRKSDTMEEALRVTQQYEDTNRFAWHLSVVA